MFDFETTKPYKFVKLVQTTTENIGKLDMVKLMKEHGFPMGRKFRLEFLDQNKYYDLHMQDGKIRPVLFGTPQLRLVIPEFCTVKHLRVGRKRFITYDPWGQVSSNQVQDYSPMDAFDFSDAGAQPMEEDGAEISDQWLGRTNEALQALSVLDTVMEAIPLQELVDIVGPCIHDP